MSSNLFTAEEERLLKTTPVQVIAAAAFSQPGDVDSIVHEMEAGASGLVSSLATAPSDVVAGIFASLDDEEYDLNAIIDADNEPERIDVIEGSLEQARTARDLLLERCGSDDSEAYARALVTAAEAAVHASRERRFLGLVETEVSDMEEVYLSRLADALSYHSKS